MEGPGHATRAVRRPLAALADAVTAVGFLVLWFAPFTFGPHGVRSALLLMLVEFVLVHATGFLGPAALDDARPRAQRLATIAGFAAFYGLFIGAFAFFFRAWWPLWVFGWLLLGKVATIVGRAPAAEAKMRLQADWVLSALLYVVFALLTTLLPMPAFGLDPSLLAQLELPGRGLWVEQPQRVIAFGALYFGALAWCKAAATALPAARAAR